MWVLDPIGDVWPDKVILYSEIDKYINDLQSSENVFGFVDESGYMLDRYEPQHAWLATTSRHQGHSITFIGQRFTQLSPIIRTNCSQCFMFAQPRADIEAIAEEYNDDTIITAPKLKQFEFLRLARFDSPYRGTVNPRTMKLHLTEKGKNMLWPSN